MAGEHGGVGGMDVGLGAASVHWVDTTGKGGRSDGGRVAAGVVVPFDRLRTGSTGDSRPAHHERLQADIGSLWSGWAVGVWCDGLTVNGRGEVRGQRSERRRGIGGASAAWTSSGQALRQAQGRLSGDAGMASGCWGRRVSRGR